MIKLQVKIMLWIFLISTRIICGAQIENINSNELLAFEDFLRAQHLKHALLLLPGHNRTRQIENYNRLFSNYTLQFFTSQKGLNFQKLFYYESPRVGVLVDVLESEHIKRSVYWAASEEGYFNSTQAWLMLGSKLANRTDEHIIRQHLSAYNIDIDADITVAMRWPQSDNMSWLLYDVYKMGKQSPLCVEPKGSWSLSGGYQIWANYSDSWLRRRSNLCNITLIGSTALIEKPTGMDAMSYLSNNWDMLQLDPMQRKTYQLFVLMARMYNLSLDVRYQTTWGQLLPNGSWTGVMGHITSGVAHFTVCPLRYLPDRQSYIQYTPLLHTQLIHFLFRHPRRNSIRNIFFEPLSPQVWWCVMALMVGSAFMLLLNVRLEQHLQRQQLQPQQHQQKPVENEISFVWFTILETFLQQGPATDQFQLPSTRILISVTCIFSFMLMQFYGAFIVGSLLSDTPRSIVNMQALFASNLEIGMEEISYNFDVFNKTTNPLVQDIYRQRICRDRRNNILSIEEGAKRIKQGGFAFHAAIDRLYRLLQMQLDENEFCELQEIMFNPPYLSGAVMPKSSPWREHLNYAMLYLNEMGLMGYNDKVWTVPKLDCSMVNDAEVEVDLTHFAPALFFMVLAMLASTLVFLLELLLGCLKPKAKATA
ncbi:glutamate receptor 1 [Drosophila grimshawi]|uniref:GH18306 n=1 Tax=Drosophila grimshawi TaxID=7222 RepID=B4JF96_DROGR|nr:glutamate receptor 1 [Drosophila grimshawi]EDV93377.1 GH18306 [Drosophila grimshawi]